MMITSSSIKKTTLFVIIASLFTINSYAQTVSQAFNASCTLTNEWEIKLPGYVEGRDEGGPVLSKDGNILIVTWNKDGQRLVSLFDSKGNKRFLVALDGNNFGSNPQQIDRDGTVYIGYYNKLYAIDPNGNTKLFFEFQDQDKDNVISSLSIINNLVITSMGTKIYAINKQGENIWTFNDSETYFDAHIVSGNNTFYLLSARHDTLYALTNKGQLKWKYSESFMADFGLPAVNKKTDTVYMTNYSHLLSFNNDGKLNWELTLHAYTGEEKPYFAPTIDEKNDTLYIDGEEIGSSDRNRYAYAIDPKGFVKWKTPLNGTADYHKLSMSPIVTSQGIIFVGPNKNSFKDEIYVLSKDGKLVCPAISLDLNLKDYSLAASKNGQLYIGKYPNSLYNKSIRINSNKQKTK